MIMFFDLEDGRPIAIRRDAIAAVFPTDKENREYTVILTIGNENIYFTVREGYKNVVTRLNWGVSDRRIVLEEEEDDYE